jgi:superfamily II DNA or RNA helicase
MDIFNGNVNNLPLSVVQDMKRIYPEFTTDRNINGNVVKVILITQSGSEGISLKNVRQVHILEPYWNYIRIRQIIGRAVRANSHAALSPKEREVQVYLYIASLTPEQKKEMVWDNEGHSSDEVIYEIAKRKDRILSEFQNLMKQAAFDCLVHKKAHRGDVECVADVY